MSHIHFKMPRSIGLKLMLVCALVVLMSIPAAMISLIAMDRTSRAEQVAYEVARDYGGEQTILGPVIVVPFTQITGLDDKDRPLYASGEYVFFAEDGSAAIPRLTTQNQRRGIFDVTTYRADVSLSGRFVLPRQDDPKYAHLDFSKAELRLGVKNIRGLQDNVFLSLPGGGERKFAPSLSASGTRPLDADGKTIAKSYPDLAQIVDLSFMSVPLADDWPAQGGSITLDALIPLSGSRRIEVLAFAGSTKFDVTSDWAHPGFETSYRPQERNITDQGFSASWFVPLQARGVAGQGEAHLLGLGTLTQNTMGVTLVNMVSPYQKVNRALKYAVLFIGLVFLGYFLFEILVGKRVHPAQYLLIGLLQSVFYLLLLALSEHIGFTLAFMSGAGAVILVTALYAGAVFGARRYALRAGALFLAIYALLFGLLRSQDFALLLGALSAFAAITLTLYITRHMDWYGGKPAIES